MINNKAPAGATHCYEHGGVISWYRETDSGLFVWRDGSWFGAAFKTTEDLMNSCMLGRLEAIPAMPALQAEDDLTWLVRESRGEWFGSHPTHIARDGDLLTWATFPRLPEGYHWFTKDQYLARRAELQNKPGWADAPEWATHLGQNMLGLWTFTEFRPEPNDAGGWSMSVKDGLRHCTNLRDGQEGEVLGDWRDTLERRPVSSGISGSEAAAGLKAFTVKATDTIDWSTAPEGATHHIGGDKLECPWHQELSHIRYWNGEKWVKRSAFHTIDGAKARGFAVVARPTDLSEPAVTERLTKATDIERKAAAAEELSCKVTALLRENPGLFSASELADLNELTDAELTKRDAAVCGGQEYIDAHWFERGELPPVGTVCEVLWNEGRMEYLRTKVFGVNEHGQPIHRFDEGPKKFEYQADPLVTVLGTRVFRPIRTERDKLIEVLKTTHAASLTNLDMLASAILAAGFKRGEA